MIAFAGALPAIRKRCDGDLGKTRAAAREGARGRRPAARADAHPRRQRRVRASQQVVRADHAADPARQDRGHRDPVPVPRQVGGKSHEVDLRDRRLANVVRRCQDLPGQELFQYIDEDGEVQRRRIGGRQRLPPRGRRRRLHGQGLPDLGRDGPRLPRPAGAPAGRRRARGETERRRGHAPDRRRPRQYAGGCPPSYVHPAVLEAYLDGAIDAAEVADDTTRVAAAAETAPEEEQAVVELLRERLEADAGRGRSDRKTVDRRLGGRAASAVGSATQR